MPSPLSVGDILALSQLALQIAKSLHDSTGSSAEFQALAADFQSLSTTLDHVYHAAKPEYLRGISLSKEFVDLVISEIAQCRSVVENFQRDIKCYEAALGPKQTNSRRWKSLSAIWYKVFWALFKKQDVVDVRAQIAKHQHRIVLLMTTLVPSLYS
jgi:hypothetical protein